MTSDLERRFTHVSASFVRSALTTRQAPNAPPQLSVLKSSLDRLRLSNHIAILHVITDKRGAARVDHSPLV